MKQGLSLRRCTLRRPLILTLCAISLAAGCVSRPRYRTDPPPSQPAKKPANEKNEQNEKNEKNEKNEQNEKKVRKYSSSPGGSTQGAYQVGLSSYYAHKFHGRPTASGEIFDMHGLTAAHRELPLGTVIRVTHLNNGRSVVVKVNDRGPFIEGRILDLSLGAAIEIDMVEEGVARVKIEILKSVD